MHPAIAPVLLALAAAAPPPGARAEGEGYRVALEAPASARPGAKGTARIVLAARPPFHVNPDYPMSFRPDAAAGPALAGTRIALGDGAERTACGDRPAELCAVSAPLPFAAPASGEARLSGTVAFSVCTAEKCLIEKVQLAAAVPVR